MGDTQCVGTPLTMAVRIAGALDASLHGRDGESNEASER
jgi:hypothetical protein